MQNRRTAGWRWMRWLLAALTLILVVAVGLVSFLGYRLMSSRPTLDGTLAVAGLSAPVTIARDKNGVPVLTGANRVDLARALGFLHGQERFFQMDMLRRAAAGELAELAGDAVVTLDRRIRPHRLRTRAQAVLAAADQETLTLLASYTEGVNNGLTNLGNPPFEYLLLRATPVAWRQEDSILVVLAMYRNLQDADGTLERTNDRLARRLTRDWALFLNPLGTFLDYPMDGTRWVEPILPKVLPPPTDLPEQQANAGNIVIEAEGEGAIGSNAWGVGGTLTADGAAMVANDMHLGLSMPNTWYRARLVMAGTATEAFDITGVTLPGTPVIIAGSNGRIAWGFTNSYIDTGDSIILERVEGQPDRYQTPDGPQELKKIVERLCIRDACSDLTVEETIWGPVIGKDAAGQRLARRWVAHDPGAVAFGPFLEMERAGTVADAIAIAHRAAMPQQNLVVGDSAGNIAWTIIGKVPNRIGFDGRWPESWADGSRSWQGYLPPERIPVILNPESSRIWTANSRIVGGEALALLGDGGYAVGSRVGMIGHRLLSKERFTPLDHLRIQLDDRGLLLVPWQALLQKELAKRAARDIELIQFLDPVRDWGGSAVPSSIGYRLVRGFRSEMLRILYTGYSGDKDLRPPPQAEGPALKLLTDRPADLQPPPFDNWDAVINEAISALRKDVEKAGGLSKYTWGERNRPGVGHPLARAIPGLSALTDPADHPLPGDTFQPRVQSRGFGASERFVVAPGHESEGIFHMPGGQSGHPLSPYYLAGHDDWRDGRPTPFLPGASVWTLTLKP